LCHRRAGLPHLSRLGSSLVRGISKARVFISYSSRDRDITRALAEALERTSINGGQVTVWWDRADDGLQAGDDYWRKIAAALDTADAAIVLWSDNALASDWVYSEACRAKGRRTIAPLRSLPAAPHRGPGRASRRPVRCLSP